MYSQVAANKRGSLLLVFGFVGFIAVLDFIISKAFSRGGLFLPILIASIIYALITYFASAKIALAMSGARPIEKADAPEYYRIVENLAITAGLPMPKVYIIDDPSPNAFATGRDPQHAVVAATSGILAVLDKDELEGVIAHEMSHVGNFDIRFMAVVVALVSVVAIISNLFLRITFWGGMGDDEENNGGNTIFFVLGIIGAILAPLVAALVQLAVSRKREYLADASGALLTRYPEGLASALEKIEADPRGLAHANAATSSLYISNPLKGKGNGIGGALAGLFSTHPPTVERIKRLRDMEGQV